MSNPPRDQSFNNLYVPSNLSAGTIVTGTLQANRAIIDELQINTTADFNQIFVDTATITDATITDATITDATITDAIIGTETVTSSSINNADITTLSVGTPASAGYYLTAANTNGLTQWTPIFPSATIQATGNWLVPVLTSLGYPYSMINGPGVITTSATAPAINPITFLYDEQWLPNGLQTLTLTNVESIINIAINNATSLTSLALPQTKYIASGLNTIGCTALTSIDLSELVYIAGSISPGSNLQTLNLPKCEFVGGTIANNAGALATINCPELLYLANFNTFNVSFGSFASALATLNMPKLKSSFGVTGFLFNPLNLSLTTISLPSLESISQFNVSITASNSTLATINLPVLTQVLATFNVSNALTALTTINCPLLAITGNITISTTAASLTTVSFPSLVRVYNYITEGKFYTITAQDPTSLGNMTITAVGPTTYSFPALTTIDRSLTIGSTSVTTINLQSLVSVGNAGLTFVSSPLLTSLNLNSLTTVSSNCVFTLGNGLTTLNLPSLATVLGVITIQSDTALTTVSMPALVSVSGNITSNSGLGNIVNFTLGTLGILLNVAGNVTVSNQSLNSTSVNNILINLAALDGTGGTTLYGAGRTVTLNGGTNAAPSGAGATAKTTLQGRGVTVNTN